MIIFDDVAPIHVAVESGNADIVKLLLSFEGININKVEIKNFQF